MTSSSLLAAQVLASTFIPLLALRVIYTVKHFMFDGISTLSGISFQLAGVGFGSHLPDMIKFVLVISYMVSISSLRAAQCFCEQDFIYYSIYLLSQDCLTFLSHGMTLLM